VRARARVYARACVCMRVCVKYIKNIIFKSMIS